MRHFQRPPRRLAAFAAVLLGLLALTACGGGGGGGGGPTAPPPVTKGFVFTPGTGTTGITLTQGAATTTTTFILEVRANSVTDLYGLAFSLQYPNTVLRYVGATAGPFLSGANLQATGGTGGAAGTVIVGLSKLGTSAGSNGSGVLLTLEFQAIATGTGAFSFSRNTAIDSRAQTLTELSWSAGTITVTL
jgi:hypothetical protein